MRLRPSRRGRRAGPRVPGASAGPLNQRSQSPTQRRARKGGQGGRVLERLAGAMGAEGAAVAVRGVVTDGVVLGGCP